NPTFLSVLLKIEPNIKKFMYSHDIYRIAELFGSYVKHTSELIGCTSDFFNQQINDANKEISSLTLLMEKNTIEYGYVSRSCNQYKKELEDMRTKLEKYEKERKKEKKRSNNENLDFDKNKKKKKKDDEDVDILSPEELHLLDLMNTKLINFEMLTKRKDSLE